MGTIISNYPVFEKNQVLTESQLNQMVKYLDQQNRLTRVSLIGLGIVCGLDVLCEAEDTLTISRGVGITSEGFLIQMGECVNTRYREYVKPASVSYPPFEDPVTHEQDIILQELLTEEAVIGADETVNDLTSEDWTDKIVLLFLECFDKDLKSCIGKSCDELGIDRIFTIRRLLIGLEDLLKVMERTNGGMPDAQYIDKFKLPHLAVPRPHFKYKGAESKTYYAMGLNYLDPLQSYAYKLFDELLNTYDVYQPILEDIYGENPFTSSILSNSVEGIQQYFVDFIGFEEPVYGVQYIYDFIRDLTLAYNEFKDVAFDLAAICCPDMTRFPKHLLLGEACESYGDCEKSSYRHYFVASPVLNNQQEKLEKVKFLHKRMVLMIEQFSIERIRDEGELKIKVTPSKEKMGYLSQRTIPFYYDTKKESEFENLTTLEKNWDYEVFRKCISSDDPLQMSYDNHITGRSPADPVSSPLEFDLDQFNFFRVEGIQGKSLKEATGTLMELKYETNLPFDVKAVYFGDLVEEEFREDCAFADLQPSYSIWRNKALLFINNLVRTNKNAETVVLNRDELYNMGTRDFASFGSSSGKKSAGTSGNEKSSFSGTSEKKTLFNLGNLSRMMSMRENLDFGTAASEISNINMTLGNIMSGAEISRSAAFESSRDTSIRGLFEDLNNCLLNMIQAMPNDFRAFDMQEWLKHYKCAMRMYINVMKFLASETTNALGMIIIHIILIVLCILFRLLRFISIYPYITIRILYDTAQERLERLQTSYQFSRFLRDHPGMEHQAGAAPGHTLVLVYQLEHLLEEKDIELGLFGDGSFLKKLRKGKGETNFFGKGFEFGDTPSDDQILEVTSAMVDNVVADFTLPYVCCDDCGDMPHSPVTLDPLATPICGVVQYIAQGKTGDDTLPWDYKPLNIRILNDLYDPSIYQVRLPEGEQPNFGTYTFERGVYDPDPNKDAQIFRYVVDEALLKEEMEINSDFFIIDEFSYEIYDRRRDEVVDSDKISIFIPVIPIGEAETATVTGSVSAFNPQGEQIFIPGVNVSIRETNQGATTTENGQYTIPNVQVGTYTMVASLTGYESNVKEVTLESGNNTVDFELVPAKDIDIEFGRTFKQMGIQPESEDARKIRDYYKTQMSDYQNAAERLVKEEGSKEVTPLTKASTSIDMYANAEEISVVKLNNDYNARRNELIESWDSALPREKKLYEESLKTLTGAYLDRLAHIQPDKLSRTTQATIKETASIFNTRKELGMKESIASWSSNAQGYMAEDYRENINDNLKLR